MMIPHRVFVTATMADRTPPDLHLFRTYPSPQAVIGVSDYSHPDFEKSKSVPKSSPTRSADQTLVWKAARASGAAPSYFRPEGRYVDGGIIANNPSLDLLTEITECNLAHRSVGEEEEVVDPEVLVSLGTGIPPVKKVQLISILLYCSFQPKYLSF